MTSRFGILAQKVGMSRIFMEDRAIPVTLLKVPGCHVLEKKEREDYVSLVLGVSEAKGKVAKPQHVQFKNAGFPDCPLVREFRVKKQEAENVGSEIKMEWLKVGNVVDVSGNSVGKGFSGPMKRWNFSGLRATHGVSLTHRSHGSTGTREKIYKGRKMAGHLGDEKVTVQSQRVVYIDDDLGLLGIAGTVPGKAGCWVKVTKAIKGFEG